MGHPDLELGWGEDIMHWYMHLQRRARRRGMIAANDIT